MPSSDTHSPPSSYALEKAVRVASRRLGRGASLDAIEQEALRLLDEEGLGPVASSPLPPPVPAATSQQSAGTVLHVSISAAACASRRLHTQRARLYDHIRKALLELPAEIRSTSLVHIRDTSSLFLGHGPEALTAVAETLGQVAEDVPVARIFGPFIDAALPENLPLIEQLPEVLRASQNICPIIQISTPDNGLSEWSIEALTYALALSRPDFPGENLVLIATNDCDRRAFGHRVHAEAIVAHWRMLSPTRQQATPSPQLPEGWHLVASADLPLTPFGQPDRTTDHIHSLPSGDPAAILQLLDDNLISGAASGARRQLLIMY